jgi:hypothetical protein
VNGNGGLATNPFPNNKISNTKYTWWNFIPKNLLEQFRCACARTRARCAHVPRASVARAVCWRWRCVVARQEARLLGGPGHPAVRGYQDGGEERVCVRGLQPLGPCVRLHKAALHKAAI